MHTARQAKPTPKNQPYVFHTATGDLLPRFLEGECLCKACESKQLRFVQYLEDAKCERCGQYQNEDLIPSNH